MPVFLAPLVSALWTAFVAVMTWLIENLIIVAITTFLTTFKIAKTGMAWATIVLAFSTMALRFFTLSANVAFVYLVFEFLMFVIDIFNKITEYLNTGADGTVTLHGQTYNVLDNFFAVLDIIGFTDAFIIVKPLLISYIIFVFTYIARKYFVALLNSSTKTISDAIQNIKVNL